MKQLDLVHIPEFYWNGNTTNCFKDIDDFLFETKKLFTKKGFEYGESTFDRVYFHKATYWTILRNVPEISSFVDIESSPLDTRINRMIHVFSNAFEIGFETSSLCKYGVLECLMFNNSDVNESVVSHLKLIQSPIQTTWRYR